MRLMKAGSAECAGFLQALRRRGTVPDPAVEATVRAILEDVRTRGDAALFDHAARLDGARLTRDTIAVTDAERETAAASIEPDVREALALAARRIEAFHRRQRRESWFVEEEGTGLLGQLVRPLARVGLYAPGGSAAYPSSVLMNAIPAKVAGVEEIALCTPVGKDGVVPPAVLAAADLAGSGRSTGSAGRRRSAPWPTGRPPSRRWTRSWGRATSTWRRPSAWSSVWWASTWWRVPARS